MEAFEAVAQALHGHGFHGRLALSNLVVRTERSFLQAISTLRSIPLPVHIGSIRFTDEWDPLACMQLLPRLAAIPQIRGIDTLNLCPVPRVGFSDTLSGFCGPCPIRKLRVGDLEEPWDARRQWKWDDAATEEAYPVFDLGSNGMSLAQVHGLSSISSLEWLPEVTAGGASALSTLQGISRLELAQCTLKCWETLSKSLVALTKLSVLRLGVWDSFERNFANGRFWPDAEEEILAAPSPLSSLGPLRLPGSVSELELYFRLPCFRKSLGLNLFEGAMKVEKLVIKPLLECNPERSSALVQDPLQVSIGNSLSALTALKRFEVSGTKSCAKIAVSLAPALSCLKSLTSLCIERGGHDIESFPEHFSVKGVRIQGEDKASCQHQSNTFIGSSWPVELQYKRK